MWRFVTHKMESWWFHDMELLAALLGFCAGIHQLVYNLDVSQPFPLTHWGQVTHICVNKITIIGSYNGLSPGRWQAIIWTKAGILLIWLLGTNFSEILIEINTFSLKKIHLKMSSGKWRPSWLGLNVLNPICHYRYCHVTLYSMLLCLMKNGDQKTSCTVPLCITC